MFSTNDWPMATSIDQWHHFVGKWPMADRYIVFWLINWFTCKGLHVQLFYSSAIIFAWINWWGNNFKFMWSLNNNRSMWGIRWWSITTVMTPSKGDTGTMAVLPKRYIRSHIKFYAYRLLQMVHVCMHACLFVCLYVVCVCVTFLFHLINLYFVFLYVLI